MSIAEPSFTVGVEEEYLLVDNETRDLVSDPPPEFMKRCEKALPGNVSPEFLRCQIEVGTPVCDNMKQVKSELARLRSTLAEKSQIFEFSPISVGTHPFAEWDKQQTTDKERYNELSMDMRVVAHRLLICGMHVHIGIEDPELRIDIFNQVSYFLPHLLALSTSSPFWRGHLTGLMSYRLAVFHELPRTGIPPQFQSDNEYKRTADILINSKVIEDASKIWWDLRPSHRFPTLELRICDACTRLADAVTIASLFRCLCRMLYRLRCQNQRWRQYSNFLIEENRWQAQRYGINASLFDFGLGHPVQYTELNAELREMLAEDAKFFDCEDEIENSKSIILDGTSADKQISTYNDCIANGENSLVAQKKVVDLLKQETLIDC